MTLTYETLQVEELAYGNWIKIDNMYQQVYSINKSKHGILINGRKLKFASPIYLKENILSLCLNIECEPRKKDDLTWNKLKIYTIPSVRGDFEFYLGETNSVGSNLPFWWYELNNDIRYIQTLHELQHLAWHFAKVNLKVNLVHGSAEVPFEL